MGDIPIFVAMDSADTWTNPGEFFLDEEYQPTVVAGVPPDYFAATGQLWGNPLYRWQAMADSGYAWWLRRIRAALRLVDLVRVDHFRGFAGYWEVPAGEKTAVNGQWVPGPGAAFFEVVQRELGDLPIIAEDLGEITPDVVELRDRFDLPGMKVLQFAFSTDASRQVLAAQLHPQLRRLLRHARQRHHAAAGMSTAPRPKSATSSAATCAPTAKTRPGRLIDAAFRSVAVIAIVPLQDVLSLVRGAHEPARHVRRQLDVALPPRAADGPRRVAPARGHDDLWPRPADLRRQGCRSGRPIRPTGQRVGRPGRAGMSGPVAPASPASIAPSTAGRARLGQWTLPLILLGSLAARLWYSSVNPFSYDETHNLMIGALAHAGYAPYREIYSVIAPFALLTMQAAATLFGSAHTVRSLGILYGLAGVAALYYLTWQHSACPKTVAAAAGAVFFSFNPHFFFVSTSLNLEAGALAFGLLAVAAVEAYRTRPATAQRAWLWLLAAGVAFGLSTTYKVFVPFVPAVIAVQLLLILSVDRGHSLRSLRTYGELLKLGLICVAGVALVLALFLLIFDRAALLEQVIASRFVLREAIEGDEAGVNIAEALSAGDVLQYAPLLAGAGPGPVGGVASAATPRLDLAGVGPVCPRFPPQP